MTSEKEFKEKFRKLASKNPNKYFPTDALKELGFKRYSCSTCKRFFWSVFNKSVCGDPLCSGGFRFIGKNRSKVLDYVGVWKEFARIHRDLGYTPIKRYPVVARWNPTTDFTMASVAAFQPHVVSGEADPPANPLVIPQFCLRFNDVDSVGLSGHFCGFTMLGELAFKRPQEYNMNQYLRDHLTWLNKGMGVKYEELAIHEDAWSGGGNLGNSLEFFADGLELSNQVYMQYEITGDSYKELKIKVLDMGQGQERAAWFLGGKGMSYDATFPDVIKRLYSVTKIKPDEKLIKKFLPYAGYLNIDEIDDIHKAWMKIAKLVKEDVVDLREQITSLAALYSIAEHSRALLVALSDGALPSNTGGGYNLRVILRRALSFIDRYRWNIDFADALEWHARELKPLFPELIDNIDDVKAIIDNEKNKYFATKEKVRSMLTSLKEKQITDKLLLNLYDTQGITPELVKDEFAKTGKQIHIPENFYLKVSELHEKVEQKHATKKEKELDLEDIPSTKALYFDDYEKTEFSAKVLKQIDKFVVLDQTRFYPTSGGQLHDLGAIDDMRVVDVFKQGKVIVHELDKQGNFKLNQQVKCMIDRERRMQLAQHHTTAHIINAAARRVLGSHVNQASAYKDMDKGRIDLTHYKSLTNEEINLIEKEANRIVAEKIPLYARFMPRTEAEKTFGMNIYQGGVVPGKELRIVEIPEVDVECCGGTHLKNTFEAGNIKILRATKISDGIIRIEYVAGRASMQMENKEKVLLGEAARLLNVDKKLVPSYVKELFEIWKDIVKKGKKRELKFASKDVAEGSDKDILELAAIYLKTQPEHVPKTIKRFIEEIKSHSS